MWYSPLELDHLGPILIDIFLFLVSILGKPSFPFWLFLAA